MENTSPSASASRSMTDKGGAPNGRPSVVDGYSPSGQPNTMGMTHQNRMGMVKSSAELHDYHMDGLAHSTQSPSDTGSSALLGPNDTVSSRSSPPNLLIDHNPSDLEQPSTPPLDLSRTAKTSTRPRTAHLTATTRNTSMKSSSPTTSAPTSASVQVGPVHEHARMLLAYMQSASIYPTSLQQACNLVASMQPHVIQEICKQLAAMQSISIQQAGMQLASMQLSMQPFSMQPSSSLQPSMQPAFEQPASRQPAPMQLGSIPRSSVQPFSMQPSSVQPASVQLTSMQTSTMQSVSMQRASMQPAYIQRASMEAAGERDVEGYDYAKYLESQPKYSLVLRNRNKSRLEGEEEWLKKIEEENVYLRALFQQQWDVKERLLFHLCYHYGRKYTPKKAPSISSIMQRASMQPASMQPASMQPASMQPASMQPASMQPASMQPGSMETASAENVEGQKDPKYSEN